MGNLYCSPATAGQRTWKYRLMGIVLPLGGVMDNCDISLLWTRYDILPSDKPFKYYVIVTTGGLRMVAWRDNATWMTRHNDKLITLDNVAYWIELPETPSSTVLTQIQYDRILKGNK